MAAAGASWTPGTMRAWVHPQPTLGSAQTQTGAGTVPLLPLPHLLTASEARSLPWCERLLKVFLTRQDHVPTVN